MWIFNRPVHLIACSLAALFVAPVLLYGCDGDGEPGDSEPDDAGVADTADDTRDADDGPPQLPESSCEPPVEPVDTSEPDEVVGDGTADSCTHDQLAEAVDGGGIVVFDCGDDEVTIELTEAIELSTDEDTVIDGEEQVRITAGGDDDHRLFEYHSPDYRATDTLVVLQGLTLEGGVAPGEDFVDQDPDNEECAWGYRDGEGGAVRMRDGRLHVIDSVFRNNRAVDVGPDTGGGAIYAVGAKEVVVTGSSFIDNEGSNGGAVGLLQSDGLFYNTEFRSNRATGEGANFGGAEGCPEFNHAEQGGAGGNGGAVVIDGADVDDVEFCGVTFRDNDAGALGTVFRTPNTHRDDTSFHRCHFEGNHTHDGGGAIWMQDMELTMTESAVIGNSSDGLGGGVRVDQGPHGSTLFIENTTIANNTVDESLGAGLVFGGQGQLRNVTFADNEVTGGEGYFGAAIVAHGDDATQLSVHNTLFADNIDHHPYTPMTCSIGSPGEPEVFPGAHNIQWPATRHGDDSREDNPCVDDILFEDPLLGDLDDQDSPTPVALPNADSPLIGAADDCPDVDQRGEPRPDSGCTIGAVEPQ